MSHDLSQAVAVTPSEYHDRRRSEPRVMCDREISVIAVASASDNARPMRARLTDCSRHGLGLMLPQQVEAGQQVMVKVDVDGRATMFLYTIRYCVPMQANEFRAGARFTGYVGSRFRGDLQAVVDRLTAGSGAA
jgi:c-di-GMP-binding flagellar brake protein YcgR